VTSGLPSLNLLHLPAVLLCPNGRVLDANHRIQRILGLPDGLLIGKDYHALYRDPADRSTLDFLLRNPSNPDGSPREDEFYLPLPGGGRLPVLMSASKVTDAGERLVTFVDVTRIKESEAVLREHFAYVTQLSNTALEQAIALKSRSAEAEAEASNLRDQAKELEAQTRELETVNRELERRVIQRTAELRQANLDAIYMLAVASEAKDHDTGAHVRRIRGLAETLARRLGFSETDAYDIGLSAVLHDVGKIHVPDAVLSKPGPLTPEERAVMQQHTLWGQRILPDRPFFKRSRLIARSHHENHDGSGYPDGLSKDQVPIEAMIVHVVDVYDALVSPRVYKPAWPPEQALEEITQKAGTHFAPPIAEAMTATARELSTNGT
jgi:PAS domain S-box-containing protein